MPSGGLQKNRERVGGAQWVVYVVTPLASSLKPFELLKEEIQGPGSMHPQRIKPNRPDREKK